MNLAHYLTCFRILVGPIFLLFYLKSAELGISSIYLPYILLGLLTLAELTDVFDGYIARKLNQVTDLGKLLDPMADSIYRISIFLTFTQPPVKLPLILIFVFLYRDLMISTLRTMCALRGFALAARASGKIKAVIQAGAALLIIFLMVPYYREEITEESLQTGAMIAVSLAAAYALFSGVEYLYANRREILRLLKGDKRADI